MGSSPRNLLWSVACAAGCVWGCLAPDTASAVPTYLYSWGSRGAGPGQFNNPIGLALDPSGNVYVVDSGNARVQVFSPSGQFVRAWPTSGLIIPTSIAVGHNGHLFLGDNQSSAFFEFTATGSYVRTWANPPGIAQYGLQIFATDDQDHVYGISGDFVFMKFDLAGQLLDHWPVPHPNSSVSAMAVDREGNVYVGFCCYVARFSPQGAGQWTSAVPDFPSSMCFDLASNLWFTQQNGSAVLEMTPAGSLIMNWNNNHGTAPGQFRAPQGIAINASGLLFVVSRLSNRVDVFGPGPTANQSTSWGRIKSIYR